MENQIVGKIYNKDMKADESIVVEVEIIDGVIGFSSLGLEDFNLYVSEKQLRKLLKVSKVSY